MYISSSQIVETGYTQGNQFVISYNQQSYKGFYHKDNQGRYWSEKEHTINISKITLTKYLKLNSLPDDIIRLLDTSSENKITIEVAVELTKLPAAVDKMKIVKNIQSLTSAQKIKAIKDFIKNDCDDAEDIIDIKEDIALEDNNIELAPSFPYVKDAEGKNVKIPVSLFGDVINLIKNKVGTLEYINN